MDLIVTDGPIVIIFSASSSTYTHQHIANICTCGIAYYAHTALMKPTVQGNSVGDDE